MKKYSNSFLTDRIMLLGSWNVGIALKVKKQMKACATHIGSDKKNEIKNH